MGKKTTLGVGILQSHRVMAEFYLKVCELAKTKCFYCIFASDKQQCACNISVFLYLKPQVYAARSYAVLPVF